jgi:hypothetical protein
MFQITEALTNKKLNGKSGKSNGTTPPTHCLIKFLLNGSLLFPHGNKDSTKDFQ